MGLTSEHIPVDALLEAAQRPEVVAAMLPYLEHRWGNPSSLHVTGIRALEGLSRDRHVVARFVHMPGLDYLPLATERETAIAAFSAGYVRRTGGSLDFEA